MGKNMKHIPDFQGEVVLLCTHSKPNCLLDTHSDLFGKLQDELFYGIRVFGTIIFVRITILSISAS